MILSAGKVLVVGRNELDVEAIVAHEKQYLFIIYFLCVVEKCNRCLFNFTFSLTHSKLACSLLKVN